MRPFFMPFDTAERVFPAACCDGKRFPSERVQQALPLRFGQAERLLKNG